MALKFSYLYLKLQIWGSQRVRGRVLMQSPVASHAWPSYTDTLTPVWVHSFLNLPKYS